MIQGEEKLKAHFVRRDRLAGGWRVERPSSDKGAGEGRDK